MRRSFQGEGDPESQPSFCIDAALQTVLGQVAHGAVIYAPGQRIEMPELAIEFRRQSFAPDRVACMARMPVTLVEVGSELDFDNAELQQLLGKVVMRVALALAPRILLPRAREIAGRVGTAPASWRVYSGRRVLGSCNSRGEVALSCACVFLPPELRDFIVCHELAHLTEMNHSARFHSLCDLYLGGNEKFLIGQLRRFQWPLPPRVRRR